MKLLIGASSSKIFHLEEFSKNLKKNNIDCQVVFDSDYADGFPSRKIGNWFKSNSKFTELINDFKQEIALKLNKIDLKKESSSTTSNFDITSSTTKKDTRLRARSIALKVSNTAASQDWKLGTFRIDYQPDGRR